MEDNLIVFKRKTAAIFSKMEDDLNFFKMEDDLIFRNGRRPQLFSNGRQPEHFVQMQDDLNILVNGRRPLKLT